MTVLPLSMRRNNCNLELCLLPSSTSLPFTDSDIINDNQNHHHPMMEESNTISPQQQQHQQKLTIFYGGKVCVCDATELQARAIISLARREMDQRMMKSPSTGSQQPSSPSLQSQALYSPTTGGLSMKRSLQRFLQKRNHRIHETASPYHR